MPRWNITPTSRSQSLPDARSSVLLVVGGRKGGLVGEGGSHRQRRAQAAQGGCQQQQLADACIYRELCQVVPCRLKLVASESCRWPDAGDLASCQQISKRCPDCAD